MTIICYVVRHIAIAVAFHLMRPRRHPIGDGHAHFIYGAGRYCYKRVEEMIFDEAVFIFDISDYAGASS